MSLLSKYARYFSQQVRERGTEYYRDHRVRIRNAEALQVDAEVLGTKPYWVSLELEGNSLLAECSCPHAETDFCKHMYALLLMAEGRHFLSALTSRPFVPLLRIGPDGLAEDNESLHPKTAEAPDLPVPPPWQDLIYSVQDAARMGPAAEVPNWPATREIWYVLDFLSGRVAANLILEIAYRDQKKDGEWTKLKTCSVSEKQLLALPDALDRKILTVLMGARQTTGFYYGYGVSSTIGPRLDFSKTLWDILLPDICRTGRAYLRIETGGELEPLEGYDAGEPWSFRLQIQRQPDAEVYESRGVLERNGERIGVNEPRILLHSGLFIHQQVAARFTCPEGPTWINHFRLEPRLVIPANKAGQFLASLYTLPHLPPLDLPEELQLSEKAGTPKPRLVVRQAPPPRYYRSEPELRCAVGFDYEGINVAGEMAPALIYNEAERCLIRRNKEEEANAWAQLDQLGFRPAYSTQPHLSELTIGVKKFPAVVPKLLAANWHVEAEGKLYRRADHFKMGVKTGIDWFDLQGEIFYGETSIKLPAVLEALKKKESMVLLGDGSYGLLPEEWLEKYGVFANLGTAGEEAIRFSRCQAGLLDALLATQTEISCDELFDQVRQQLGRFAGVQPIEPQGNFQGTLRPYQKEALGWFEFLRQFGFGGCLADDMGLGKTVQVLALLESRRQERGRGKENIPSLVVVPKSLIFNWKQEAARFVPELRLLDHTGVGRLPAGGHFTDYDLILTTYGTLRRDALEFKDIEFNYVILDEAQAIKNASTDSSKASRLLHGRHRLALSGTPIENHLGELWTLFEFLNPGLLGSSAAFRQLSGSARKPSMESRALLAHALRPFILRRTKKMVEPDLPAKLEQTLYCEMEKSQAAFYEELRQYYRGSLLKRIEKDGIQKSKILILEALLRLRQAACHPALVDKKKKTHKSAKLDLLMEHLDEILDEGHKVLVFSQFTSFLALVRQQLEEANRPYLYLDGATRKRGELVNQFQNDPNSRLFLISLKAGGLGLNLTAAEYVILLDPWWNPAVEAQAIDRTHRIGQSRQVFAYRMITKGTVEEKVLELQQSKRELADFILSEDKSLIRSLQREDLELLLS